MAPHHMKETHSIYKTFRSINPAPRPIHTHRQRYVGSNKPLQSLILNECTYALYRSNRLCISKSRYVRVCTACPCMYNICFLKWCSNHRCQPSYLTKRDRSAEKEGHWLKKPRQNGLDYGIRHLNTRAEENRDFISVMYWLYHLWNSHLCRLFV